MTRFWYSIKDVNLFQAEGTLKSSRGKRVLDTFPELIKLVQFDRNLILDVSIGIVGNGVHHYNGLRDDEGQFVGEEKLQLRAVKLVPGNYGWCGVVKTMSGLILPNKSLPCFPFVVLEK